MKSSKQDCKYYIEQLEDEIKGFHSYRAFANYVRNPMVPPEEKFQKPLFEKMSLDERKHATNIYLIAKSGGCDIPEDLEEKFQMLNWYDE